MAICTRLCVVAALTLPLQKHPCTGAGLQPPTCPLPPPTDPGRSLGPGLGPRPSPASALAAWAEAALPAPVCHAAGAARSCRQPDEKGDCSAAFRGRYAASHRQGSDRCSTGQLWAQAQARSTPGSLARDRRAAHGPVPAADTQSTSVTCSLRLQAPRASHKAQHGQPAMRPAGLADHSFPSKSQQPSGVPGANTASTGVPSKGTAGEPTASGQWGDSSALIRLPPQRGRHASRCEPQAVVLLERLMLLVESKGGLPQEGLPGQGGSKSLGRSSRQPVPGWAGFGGGCARREGGWLGASAHAARGSADHRALCEAAPLPLPKSATEKSGHGLEKNPVLKPVSGHKAENKEPNGEHGPEQPFGCHKDMQEQQSSAWRLLMPSLKVQPSLKTSGATSSSASLRGHNVPAGRY